MARTVITPVAISKIIKKGDAVSGVTAVTIDAALVAAEVAVDAGLDSRVYFKIINTAAVDKTVTIQSNLSAIVDDFTVSLATNGVAMFILETNRFEAQEGTDKGLFLIDFEEGTTGTIEVYSIPK